jgi:hypothetical protein
LGKKKGEEAEPSQDDTDHSLLLAPKIWPFRNWSYISFPLEFQSSILCVSMPLWYLEKGNGQMDFLRKAYKIHHYKKGIMVTPPYYLGME